MARRRRPPTHLALEAVLLRVSEMVCALPQLREMDINPIIVDEHGAVAVDARIVVDDANASPGSYRPPGHPALPHRTRTRMAVARQAGARRERRIG